MILKYILTILLEWFELTREIDTKLLRSALLHTNSIVFFCSALTIRHWLLDIVSRVKYTNFFLYFIIRKNLKN